MTLPSAPPVPLIQLLQRLFGIAPEDAQAEANLIEDCLQGTSLSHESVQMILDAAVAQDARADQAQKRRTAYAVIVALLAPISVFSLACETLPAWSTNFHVKIIFIAVQLFLIGLALFSIKSRWATSWTHNAWLPARLRAELLRRELFLYLARLGPYLDITDPAALAGAVETRVRAIAGQDARGSLPKQENSLLDLVALEPMPSAAPGVECWRDSLEDAYRQKPASFSGTLKPALISLYAVFRVEDQRRYYERKHHHHEMLDERYDGLSTWAIGLAFLITIVDLVLTLREEMGSPGSETMEPVTVLVWILAPFLPTVGVFFITLRSFFENQRLSRSFADQVPALTRLEESVKGLKPDPNESFLSSETVFQLRRLVLRTETILSEELRRWWHILEPERPHG